MNSILALVCSFLVTMNWFQASLETLSVTWNYTDPDSGISQIKLGIYETKAGGTKKIYPTK